MIANYIEPVEFNFIFVPLQAVEIIALTQGIPEKPHHQHHQKQNN